MESTFAHFAASAYTELQKERLEIEGTPKIKEINLTEYFAQLFETSFLIYSPTALRKSGIAASALHSNSLPASEVSISLSHLAHISIPAECDEIVVFGTGVTIDAAKYLANKHGTKLTVIPALLSTNAFGTPFGCYEQSENDGTKTTLKLGYADQILVDFNYLEGQTPEALYGLVDVLSIATALYDWDLAIAQGSGMQNQFIYNLAISIRDEGLKMMKEQNIDIRSAFTLILNSAYITGLYGSGRPESGSEHIFSKSMELRAMRDGGAPVMHGESVSIGLLVMSTLQGNPLREDIFEAVRRLGVLDTYADDHDALKKAIVENIFGITPHSERYSVVNEYQEELNDVRFCEELADRVITDFFSKE